MIINETFGKLKLRFECSFEPLRTKTFSISAFPVCSAVNPAVLFTVSNTIKFIFGKGRKVGILR